MKSLRILSWLAPVLFLAACQDGTRIVSNDDGTLASWTDVMGGKGGGQYSPLTQINRQNVKRLKVAWTYSSNDYMGPGGYEVPEAISGGAHASSSIVVNPIIADGKMLICTPLHRVIALDPASGKEIWSFDPKMDMGTPSHFCRGVASWTGSRAATPPAASAPAATEAQTAAAAAATATASDQVCAQRVFFTSGDNRLIGLDLATGLPCADFGNAGTVNLEDGMGPVKRREMYQTAPPLVLGDLVITGSGVRDSFRTDTVGGAIRAYDARSGRLVWGWDPVPPDMPAVTAEDVAQGKTFTRGTPNAWSMLSADEENGLVFVPTGNPGGDYFRGHVGNRPLGHYGSSVVALNAATGKVVWHFQTVHHDIWDYDSPAQPVLYEHQGPQGKIPALALATKQGHIFLLNRLTGKPLFPVEERPVPKSDIPEEWTSPTQPYPTLPRPVLANRLTDDDIMNYPWASKGCKALFARLRYEGMFTPPSTQGTLIHPGISGGFNWGNMAIDPATGTMVATYLNMPFITTLVPRTSNRTAEEDNDPVNWMSLPQYGTPYEVRNTPFLSENGVPCVKPPWGVIMAVNLWTGETLWEKPLGNLSGRVPLIGQWLNVGVPVSGGPMQTASGLVFVGASADSHFRAFDAATGKVLWSTELPFSSHAVPMSYRLQQNGKQYVVIATGGTTAMDTKIGNTLVAYALPD